MSLLCSVLPVAAGFARPGESRDTVDRQPQVVDRIVAHIEDDIITLSEVRELAAYQQLVDGHAEPDDRILNELIEQWVVNNEATATQFPQPAESEVNREVARIQATLPEPQAYNERLAALGITPDAVTAHRHAGNLSGALPRLQVPPGRAGGRRGHRQVLPANSSSRR